ncbi:hypothetical protein NPIL_307031 [Nephila pilipes]|uniref:Uncharacterized protein n=1 Tax=Nephila pilipes TaxID=299642 RepID=A0A8X6PRH1_NEPPI|nr:hypothetical protein NPIL_307031 [Nephila pilipes]
MLLLAGHLSCGLKRGLQKINVSKTKRAGSVTACQDRGQLRVKGGLPPPPPVERWQPEELHILHIHTSRRPAGGS